MKAPALAAYALLGLPLAMAMLPIYVLVPNFYAADLGLGLTLTGTVLFLARLLDTVQDPWLGRLIDRRSARGWKYGMSTALGVFALTFAVLLCLGGAMLLRAAPRPQRVARSDAQSWRLPLSNGAFRRLAGVYFINAVAVAIPATLALFFIADRLQLAKLTGLFLALYFVSGALGLPFWTRLADRLGKRRSWRLGMLTGCAAFIWAVLLEPGSAWAYAGVCVLSGLALGADLALPPALLADIIPAGQRDSTAAYFGLWSFLAKLALALAGLALPLLAWVGYQPGSPAAWNLALVYAGLPCLLKLLAARLLTSLPCGDPTP